VACVLRLIVAALLLMAGQAHALVPKQQGFWYVVYGVQFPTGEQACAEVEARQDPVYTVSNMRYVDTAPARCAYTLTHKTNGTVINTSSSVTKTSRGNVCPANSTDAGGGQCQCNSGYVENSAHTACEPAPVASEKWKQWCENASSMPPWFTELPGRGTKSGCQNLTLAGSPIDTPGYVGGEVPLDAGCKIALDNAKSFPDADGNWYTQGDARVTGSTCRESDPTEGDPEGTEKQPAAKDPPCVGGYQGEVNGVSVCAKPDPNKGVDWAGTKETTNPDGSKTTKETDTKCNGSTCTTTEKTTTKDASGNVTGTSTTSTTESRGSLCSRDSGNGVCKGGGGGDGDGESSFSGTCAGGFKAVSDDAVVNAMAEEQYRRNCQFFEKTPDPTDESQAYDAMKAKGQAGQDQTGDLPAASRPSFNMSPSDLDSSNALGVSQCLSDLTIVVMDKSIVLPLSDLCPWLEYLGYILMVCAYLYAARIVIGG